MSMHNRKCLIVSILLLTGVLIPSLSCISLCYADDQQSSEKAAALLFLREVARIDVSAYATSVNWQVESPLITDYFYPRHQRTHVEVHLAGGGRETGWADVEFIDGKFDNYYSERASAAKENLTSSIAVARYTLEHYASSFNATYCKSLEDALDRLSGSSSQIVETDNAVLELTGTNTYCWTFKMNGAVSRPNEKVFSIGVDDELALICLTDRWGRFSIGNAQVNVSKEEAINIGLGLLKQPAKNGSDLQVIQRQVNEEGAKIVATQATLYFDNDRGDCFTLYPSWEITYGYDRFYGSINGFAVRVWADTGQVHACDATGTLGVSAGIGGGADPSGYWLFLIGLVVALFVIPGGLLLLKKRRFKRR